MTENEKIKRVQAFLDPQPTDAEAAVYLGIARDLVMAQRYPYGYDDFTEFPAQYEAVQCELAARKIARKGGIGETAHNENGINRTWASEDDSDLLRKIVPLVKVVGNAVSNG